MGVKCPKAEAELNENFQQKMKIYIPFSSPMLISLSSVGSTPESHIKTDIECFRFFLRISRKNLQNSWKILKKHQIFP